MKRFLFFLFFALLITIIMFFIVFYYFPKYKGDIAFFLTIFSLVISMLVYYIKHRKENKLDKLRAFWWITIVGVGILYTILLIFYHFIKVDYPIVSLLLFHHYWFLSIYIIFLLLWLGYKEYYLRKIRNLGHKIGSYLHKIYTCDNFSDIQQQLFFNPPPLKSNDERIINTNINLCFSNCIDLIFRALRDITYNHIISPFFGKKLIQTVFGIKEPLSVWLLSPNNNNKEFNILFYKGATEYITMKREHKPKFHDSVKFNAFYNEYKSGKITKEKFLEESSNVTSAAGYVAFRKEVILFNDVNNPKYPFDHSYESNLINNKYYHKSCLGIPIEISSSLTIVLFVCSTILDYFPPYIYIYYRPIVLLLKHLLQIAYNNKITLEEIFLGEKYV